jgi:hypothetical protein
MTTNTTTDTPSAMPPASPWYIEGMGSNSRIALAMQELSELLPVVFPDPTPCPPAPTIGGVVAVHLSTYEVSVQVSSTMLVDAAMTGTVVCVETREVYHNGPDKPATLHYEAWLPNLLPESKLRVKVTACETVGSSV